MHDLEILRVMASLGYAVVVMAGCAYLVGFGYVIGRPNKIEREIIHRALENATPSPDPIVQKRAAKLIEKFKPKSDS